ncbi:intradiol ring-cleavage dioxygenase [Streptomyces sp. NPDC050619]|uniref:intradiol ring-cleavage dioxygenase n=1 Tax=Streptomyces sp. NPDC050619 TaxID=3157214 RepID=UPI0034168877
MNEHHEEVVHEQDRGLSYDLPLLARRRMVRLLAGVSLVPLVGCTSEEETTASSSPSLSPSSASSPIQCETIPEETEGPFPGDGSNGVNVLRESGVVRSDITKSFGDSARGTAEVKSIFPGCYPNRWPHVHFEVYGSLADATAARSITNTSQLALPKDVSDRVYATDGYSGSVGNLSELSLESDSVFSDGYDQQLATVTGSAEQGYTATLTVPV